MATEFLSAVLPTQGKYCVFVTDHNKLRKNIFVDTLDALLETAQKLDAQRLSAYMAMSSYDDAGRRKAENAQTVRALFMDLDCGQGKTFQTKRHAVECLHKFLTDIHFDKLGTPWLVDSGGGVHVHMPFYHDIPVADWLPLAEAMKNAAVQHSFPMDMTVSADAARVLRIPGLHNFKKEEPRPVVLRATGTFFAVEDVAQMLEPYKQMLFKPKTAIMIPGTAPSTQMTSVAKALTGNRVTWFRNIIQRTKEGTGCAQIAHYIQHAADDGMEPLWRACLSVAKYCEDGPAAAAKLSKLHPYDEDRMQRKLHEIVGPYTCAKFEAHNPGHCAGCPNLNKINSPISLGAEMAKVQERVIEEENDQGETVKRVLPTPPRGFAYGRNGGVLYIKEGDDEGGRKEVLLLTYDLYVQGIFFEPGKSTYSYSLVAEKPNEIVTFVINPEVLGDAKALVKVLARNNVFAMGGAHHDMYLASYVRACMTEASMNKRYVMVPAHLGWQDDGSFAVGDEVLSAQGAEHDYRFQSKDLHNVIEATRAMGSLVEWRKVPEMIMRKARKDRVMLGHAALMYSNFASPLMIWGPDGARACSGHICGKGSGIGKTYSSMVSNSVWGAPSKLKVSNTTSETTVLQRAGLLGSIMLHVDEITSSSRDSDGEFLPKFLYNFSSGAHKLKGSASGNSEITQNCTWVGFSHVSSNDPQLEFMMGARRHSSQGEARRMVEWQIPSNYVLTWTDEEREINALLEHNHGVAGRKYMRWLLDNKDTAYKVYKQVEARWRALVNALDSERYWTNAAVSHLTAVILCTSAYADIIDGDYELIEQWWVERIQHMRSVIDTNSMSAMDVLNAYIREYGINMLSVGPTHSLAHLTDMAMATIARGPIRGRVESDVTPGVVDNFIEISALKRHCAHLGISYMEFTRELASVPGVQVRECVRNLLKGFRGPILRTKCLQITRNKADADLEENSPHI